MVFLIPHLILLCLGLAGIVLGVVAGRRTAAAFGVVGFIVCILALIPTGMLTARALAVGPEGMDLLLPLYITKTFAFDPFAMFFVAIALIICALTMLFSVDYVREILPENHGEFMAMIAFASLAMTCVASARDLITIYFSVEFLSITGYIMAGFLRKSPPSIEASLKYFLLGVLSSTLMLFGMSYLYGATGTTNVTDIARSLSMVLLPPGAGLQPVAPMNPVILTAVFLIAVGLGFKVALVPFHQWVPDVFEGAPTPVTAFLSVGPKAAGIAVVARVFLIALTPRGQTSPDWVPLMAILCALTITVGNIAALRQRNIKRLLAYSTIAQAGYILIGIVAVGSERFAMQGVLLYVLGYVFFNLGAFTVVIAFSNSEASDQISAYDGLIHRSPFLAASWVVFALSLAGVPPTIGWAGKWYLFMAAVDVRLYWLAVVGALNTVISIYYYFEVTRRMFFQPPARSTPIRVSPAAALALGISLAGTLLLILFLGPLSRWVDLSRIMLAGR